MNPADPGMANKPVWEEDSREKLPILDYLQLLWFRRKLIAAITIFVGVIAYIHISELKHVYSAQSSMLIGIPQQQVVDIESVLSRSNSFGDVNSEIEVLKSRVLAARVVERLDLVNDPEFNPSLRKPEKSFFDFLKYLNPKTWIPADWM